MKKGENGDREEEKRKNRNRQWRLAKSVLKLSENLILIEKVLSQNAKNGTKTYFGKIEGKTEFSSTSCQKFANVLVVIPSKN